MTDLEYGKAWAEMMGVEVCRAAAQVRGRWQKSQWWMIAEDRLPRHLKLQLYHLSEAAAYTALGRAVRAIHAAVPRLPGDA